MQRMASAAGLAYLSHEVHLSIHPEYSTWFAIRGCVVVQGMSGPAVAPPPPVCSVSDSCLEAAAAALKIAARGPPERQTHADMANWWKLWVAVRDAVDGGGHSARYTEDQIKYHYTGDRAVLEQAAATLNC